MDIGYNQDDKKVNENKEAKLAWGCRRAAVEAAKKMEKVFFCIFLVCFILFEHNYFTRDFIIRPPKMLP
jgi:hypothetical protein